MTDTTNKLVFVPLSSGLRRGLESSVVGARGVVEAGVGRVFDRLGVERSGLLSSRVPVGLSDDEKVLRLVVGVKVRQAGSFDAAVEEVAFGVWHRMLFARFLAENGLLMHPEYDVAVTLDECEELAHAGWGADRWVVASRFASEMLPGLFPVDDPLGRVELLPEDLHALERVLDGIPLEVFASDDGLGWVYQFWQSLRKDEVNASEVKIGARELPAVTQLFTEHYMVRFLLENSLGAWWAARHPDSPLIESFEYLRFDEDGGPAAGSFDEWPDGIADVTALDPCCGSGHFLTSLFEMLWRMRVEEEGLSPVEAQDRVLAENLFGLELDARCTQIAAFNVALAAWKAGGYRQLPELNIACSGIRVAGSKDSWLEVAGDDPRLRDGLERLHDVFKDADTLGSLIDPKATIANTGLMAVDWDEIQPLLDTALTREKTIDPAQALFGRQAAGVAKAATLLSQNYTLVATNPPFLDLGRGSNVLTSFTSRNSPSARGNLATLMLSRSLQGWGPSGAVGAVLPEEWLLLRTYSHFRESILNSRTVIAIAALGSRAFGSTAVGSRVRTVLTITARGAPALTSTWLGLDATSGVSPELKGDCLSTRPIQRVHQLSQLENPDSRMSAVVDLSEGELSSLSLFAGSTQGLVTRDSPRFVFRFWEVRGIHGAWDRYVAAPSTGALFGGRERVLRWEGGRGGLLSDVEAHNFNPQSVLASKGILVAKSHLGSAAYLGELFDHSCVPIVPLNPVDLLPILAFVRSPDFPAAVRRINTKIIVDSGYMVKVPFDVEFWRERAAEEFPGGLPEPWSDDPTQWLFLGDPADSIDPLQVGAARLLGYRWPDQEADNLDRLVDEDGIVCLPSVMGERPAADRLRELLVAAFGTANESVGLIDGLLAEADAEGKDLDWWLENRFFKQHHQLFHKRPFIWHITDHHKDGFSALVNYHRLDRAGLERLTFNYLGWWIDARRADVAADVAGADDKLAAAEELQDTLKLILEGEPPYDIYVRWKTLAEQPIGWDPDLDDGVRLNIRPFVEAAVLKIKKPPGIKWGKDRGKNPDGSERMNNIHFNREEKQIARDTT